MRGTSHHHVTQFKPSRFVLIHHRGQTTMFTKIRFSNHATSTDPECCTAGLVIDSDKLKGMSITDVSRLYPMSEARKMRGVLQVSKDFDTWNEAFHYQFGIKD